METQTAKAPLEGSLEPAWSDEPVGVKGIMNALNEKGMDLVLAPENLRAAYYQVKKNRGACGVDGIGVDDLEGHLRKHWAGIERKLRSCTYQPTPVKRVAIPKPGGGERELGIPTTQDRLIQQALANELSPLFEPLFSEHSYGYRPGRSAHDAVRKMQHYVVEEGRSSVVDIDIKGFFDNLDHDILMREVSRVVTSKEVLRLIGSYLRAGKLGPDNCKTKTYKGVPQGGPLSPLLANIYLNVLDHELESRGVKFVRYADDVTIYAKSPRSAERTYERVKSWIARKLKLEVNEQKSGPRKPDAGSFLGFRIVEKGKVALSEKSVHRYKAHVRHLFDAQRPREWETVVKEWQSYVRGWTNYFCLSEWWDVSDLAGWTRRHMRKLCWQRWHNWRGRRNAFIRLGASARHLQVAHSSRGAWRIAASPALQTLLNNQRLRDWGFFVPSDLVRNM